MLFSSPPQRAQAQLQRFNGCIAQLAVTVPQPGPGRRFPPLPMPASLCGILVWGGAATAISTATAAPKGPTTCATPGDSLTHCCDRGSDTRAPHQPAHCHPASHCPGPSKLRQRTSRRLFFPTQRRLSLHRWTPLLSGPHGALPRSSPSIVCVCCRDCTHHPSVFSSLLARTRSILQRCGLRLHATVCLWHAISQPPRVAAACGTHPTTAGTMLHTFTSIRHGLQHVQLQQHVQHLLQQLHLLSPLPWHGRTPGKGGGRGCAPSISLSLCGVASYTMCGVPRISGSSRRFN